MRPSEINERNDKYLALAITAIIHAAIIAAIFFVGMPKQVIKANIKNTTTEIVQQQPQSKPKA